MSMENVILTIVTIWLLGLIYFLIRNYKVFNFRMYIADLIYSKGCDMINDGASHRDIFYLWDMLDDISHEEMLYSFKPLKMECWFTDEELKSLGYEKDLQSNR